MSKRLTDRNEHCFIVERLFDELRDTGLHRLNRERNVSVAGDDDDGSRRTLRSDFLDQFHSVRAGHTYVGHDTGAVKSRRSREEGGGRRKTENENASEVEQKHEKGQAEGGEKRCQKG